MIKFNNKCIALVVLSLIALLSLVIIYKPKDENKGTDIVPFSDTSYCRDNGVDTECIYFGSDRSFGYSEVGAGNPVDDYDLCEMYNYKLNDNYLTINCSYGKDSENIDIISYSEDSLVLKFNNEQREFKKRVEE